MRHLRRFAIAGRAAFLASPFLSGVAFAQTVEPSETGAPSSGLVQAHQDWRVSCPQNTPESCRVWQRVQVEHEGSTQDVMSVSFAPANEGFALLVQLPLDVYLPDDFGLRVDGRGERRIRYRNCNETGCWVVAPADDRLLNQFRRGITAEAAINLIEGETVRISFSLRGFTAAFAAFEEVRDSFD